MISYSLLESDYFASLSHFSQNTKVCHFQMFQIREIWKWKEVLWIFISSYIKKKKKTQILAWMKNRDRNSFAVFPSHVRFFFYCVILLYFFSFYCVIFCLILELLSLRNGQFCFLTLFSNFAVLKIYSFFFFFLIFLLNEIFLLPCKLYFFCFLF